MTAPAASGWSELPGGPCTHWKTAPLHGAHPKRTATLRLAAPCDRPGETDASRVEKGGWLPKVARWRTGKRDRGIGFEARGNAVPKNTICPWYDKDAEAAA